MQINKEELQKQINTIQNKLGVRLNDVFASYHFQTKDFKYQGFGNIVSKFPLEMYQGNMGKFVEDFQKTIEMALYTIHKMDFEIKILFWRG